MTAHRSINDLAGRPTGSSLAESGEDPSNLLDPPSTQTIDEDPVDDWGNSLDDTKNDDHNPPVKKGSPAFLATAGFTEIL